MRINQYTGINIVAIRGPLGHQDRHCDRKTYPGHTGKPQRADRLGAGTFRITLSRNRVVLHQAKHYHMNRFGT